MGFGRSTFLAHLARILWVFVAASGVYFVGARVEKIDFSTPGVYRRRSTLVTIKKKRRHFLHMVSFVWVLNYISSSSRCALNWTSNSPPIWLNLQVWKKQHRNELVSKGVQPVLRSSHPNRVISGRTNTSVSHITCTLKSDLEWCWDTQPGWTDYSNMCRQSKLGQRCNIIRLIKSQH